MIATAEVNTLSGLTQAEAERRQAEFGLNEIPEVHTGRLQLFLKKLWGFVPWMLEATILFQLVLGKVIDAGITLLLLLVNAIISFLQEDNARKSLALLQSRLTIQARVLRDQKWLLLPASELVPGDIIRLRLGDMTPADVKLMNGQLAADQSALTGESSLAEIEEGGSVYAASIIKRGEGIAVVTATGANTFYGKTAKLVQTAKSVSHGESIIQQIVQYLMLLNVILIVLMFVYTLVARLPAEQILPFILILLVASIPVALPATFTLATAIGARDLVKRGVLATRLAAIKEAAGMDVLCSDKTGTITRNELAVVEIQPCVGYSAFDVLRLANYASDEATHDPIDMAIIAATHEEKIDLSAGKRLQFIPFDSTTKRTEAVIRKNGVTKHVVKGMPQLVGALTRQGVPQEAIEKLSAKGYRVLAVAAGVDEHSLDLIGLIALQDPPRKDSAAVIEKLQNLGVRVLMITGDALETARAVAVQVGIAGKAAPAEQLRAGIDVENGEYGVFSGVFPEDKFRLVERLQQAGHIVGMTGDGVNDAPALRQAEIGAAVANATDVAKSAAGVVLVNPGLEGLLATVEVGRRIYQRTLTYTLNKIIKTFQIALFLCFGLIVFGIFVTRPTLILLLLLANDFVTMSLTTDNVRPSAKPNRWDVRALVVSGLLVAGCWLLVSFGVLIVGQYVLRLDIDRLQTLIFLMLVFTGQANVYLIRERDRFWTSRPSKWMLISTVMDVIVVCFLAIRGVLMTPIEPVLVFGLLGAVVLVMIPFDFAKVWIFQQVGLRNPSQHTDTVA